MDLVFTPPGTVIGRVRAILADVVAVPTPENDPWFPAPASTLDIVEVLKPDKLLEL